MRKEVRTVEKIIFLSIGIISILMQIKVLVDIRRRIKLIKECPDVVLNKHQG